MLKRFLYLILVTIVALPTIVYAQKNAGVYQKLLKRYGNVTRWNNSFIVKIGYFYALADSNGHFLTGFVYDKFDTVLNDRAIACANGNNVCSLITPDGFVLHNAGSDGFILLNKEKRLFARTYGEQQQLLLYNDNGRQLTNQVYDPSANIGMISINKYEGRHFFGIMTPDMDTILPMQYQSVSFGKELYAGFRNDTAFVYNKNDRRLLFTLGLVHNCRIFPNDFIVVKKYGMYALVNRYGKLLSGFVYHSVEEFKYANERSSAKRGTANGNEKPAPYLLVNRYGLIDSLGRAVLPDIYDRIEMNTNGWFILNEERQTNDRLVDPNKKLVLEAHAYDLKFTNERYAIITKYDIYTGNSTTRTYDMLLRKFVAGIPPGKQKNEVAETTAPEVHHERRQQYQRLKIKDTIEVNMEGTILLRSNGRWGVLSVTGDTVLPFIYDTAGLYAYYFYYVGLNGRFATLDAAGDMVTPLELPEPPWYVKDSFVFMKNKVVYDIRSGHIRKVNIEKEPVADFTLQVGRSGITWHDQSSSPLRRGVYNRQLKRIGDKLLRNSNGAVKDAGIAAITDTCDEFVTVTDSTGKQMIPWIQKPTQFMLYDHTAIAVGKMNTPDVLYRFTGTGTITDTIQIDSNQKKKILGVNTRASYEDQVDDLNDMLFFSLPGYGGGYVSSRSPDAVMIQDLERIIKDNNGFAQVKINGKWGLYDKNGIRHLPPEYDSIKYVGQSSYIPFKANKMGLYDCQRRLLYPSIYDTMLATGSLENHFLIVHTGKEAMFLDDKNKVISSGWENVPTAYYSAISGIPASKNGIKYKLYPTTGDSLLTIPDVDLPPGVTSEQFYMDNITIVKKDDKKGVYDIARKKWIVPAIYSSIQKEEDDYFAITGGDHPTTTGYKPDGTFMFTIKGSHNAQKIYPFNQWYMNGWYGPPIVNYKGKIIVPDTFHHVFTTEYSGRALYRAVTKNGMKAIIDTTGKVMVPAILDYIVDDNEWMYNGYFMAEQHDKFCLLSPKGKMLTKCIYEDITPGLKRETYKEVFLGRRSEGYRFEDDTSDGHPYFIVNTKDTGSRGVIDSNGRTLLPCIYDSISQVHKGKIAVVQQGGKWGLLNMNNKPVTGFVYDSIGIFHSGVAKYKRGNTKGMLTMDGQELTPEKE